ncbi:MAG: C25 family cysteine peptidase, partial [bacterium]
WPVSSAAEFTVVAEKMKSYEAGENFGNWRNRITLIADDENHSNSLPERQHTEDSERLADVYIPAQFDLDKIYAVDYPFGTGGEKPEVREAIIRNINSGTLIVNYVGHGNPNVWADERIFRRTQDIPRLSNRDKLPLIFNASCSIGFFDDPLLEGMAEDFLSYAAGGAIGTVSATRLVYSRPNAEFNKTAFYYLLGDYDFTVAEATYVAKLVRQNLGQQTNDRKYIYIGDPLTRLGFAPLKIDFATFSPDSLVALTVTELAGAVRDPNGVLQSEFDGTVDISVLDNERERVFQFPPFTDSVTYSEYGPAVYRGKVAVTAGEFELKFVVPKDITYGGRKARISGYASDGVTGAAGYIYPIAIGGINTEVTDTTGPEIIAYFAGDPNLADGANVSSGTEVTLELFDSLGINLSGEIGHTIDLLIDDDPALTYVLNEDFSYNPGSYQAGVATMKLPGLTTGPHTLKVKAWDSANNSSQLELAFNIGEQAGLEISELLCYPNPVQESCEFSYYLSRTANEVALKIFTLSGLEIYVQEGLPRTAGYHGGIHWSGYDADGDRPANGVYIFQLSAQTLDSGVDVDDNKVTANEKLIIMK